MTDRNEMTHEAVELELYLENSSEYYNQIKAIRQNLNNKALRGSYSKELAPKAWIYVVDRAAKGYVREFCSSNTRWHDIFTPACRRQVARNMAEQFEQSVEFGRIWN